MHTVIHRIRLNDGVDPAQFEAWVREVDYASCPGLPSVRAFSVQRVGGESAEYFEIIDISSRDAFAADMRSATFRRLESEFGRLAAVVDGLTGERVEPGYRA